MDAQRIVVVLEGWSWMDRGLLVECRRAMDQDDREAIFCFLCELKVGKEEVGGVSKRGWEKKRARKD